jgi:hypothetical protein
VAGNLTNTNSKALCAISKKAAWFAGHLAVVYLTVKVCTPWLAGRVHDLLLSSSGDPGESQFQFLFSHLLALSFIPGFLAGLVSFKYRHTIALFVWVVPGVILAYQFYAFPASALESHTAVAYHEYFGGDFMIPEYQNYRDLFVIASTNADLLRGVEQVRFTAPFYTAIAYSLANLITLWVASCRGRISQKAPT